MLMMKTKSLGAMPHDAAVQYCVSQYGATGAYTATCIQQMEFGGQGGVPMTPMGPMAPPPQSSNVFSLFQLPNPFAPSAPTMPLPGQPGYINPTPWYSGPVGIALIIAGVIVAFTLLKPKAAPAAAS